MISVTFYYQKDCAACQAAEQLLDELQVDFPHKLVKINIDDEPILKEEFQNLVPVVQIGPYRLSQTFTRQDLQAVLGAARDRSSHLERIDEGYVDRIQKNRRITGTDRFTRWMSHHYMVLFNFVVFLFVGLPFLAPVLMKSGIEVPGKVIYSIYSPLCHQLAFRSWFLFGEQPYYPRALANVPGVINYEQLTNENPVNVWEARSFVGNDQIGYKVALCERDVAIYGGILLFGLIFAASKQRIKGVPWYVWILVGLVPIGLDGVSQLPSLAGLNLPFWIPMRESTPLLRSLTGGLFGFFTAWYIYPLIEETMKETRRLIVRKFAYHTQVQSGEATD
ncbi:MAG: DUF2085 domain-containing protein [Chloroflexi bacterium]|jgi:uncharacterized membrane protein/arsenate reductase-like glutaredoxin family protein|nr:DUF2085 domain-containing protein [Chloroflexota bacterium]